MSKESRQLIRSMLQVNPKKRITVEELLSHPWMTLGVLEPVKFDLEECKHFDVECINTMAKHYQVSSDEILNYLKEWKYDYHTATYFLLLARKKRGSTLRLSYIPAKLPVTSNNVIF